MDKEEIIDAIRKECPICPKHQSCTNWIEIEQRKPPQNTRVLIAVYDGREKVKMHFIDFGFRLGKAWFRECSCKGEDIEVCSKYGYVTHWMPLPDMPT